MKHLLVFFLGLTIMTSFLTGCRSPSNVVINNKYLAKARLENQVLLIKPFPGWGQYDKYSADYFGKYLKEAILATGDRAKIVYSADINGIDLENLQRKLRMSPDKPQLGEAVDIAKTLGCSSAIVVYISELQSLPHYRISLKLWWIDDQTRTVIMVCDYKFDNTVYLDKLDFQSFVEKNSLPGIGGSDWHLFLDYAARQVVDLLVNAIKAEEIWEIDLTE